MFAVPSPIKTTFFALALSLSFGATAVASELSGREIFDESADRHDLPFEYEEQQMILHDKKGNQVERALQRYSRKGENDLYKYLIVFNSPAGVQGVALLTWQQQDDDDSQWMFLPAKGKKLKRIVKGAKRSYFMGTDFAFEDLSSENRDYFRYERIADSTEAGQDVYVVNVYPEHPSIKKDTGYKYRTVYMSKELLYPLKIEFFDRRGKPFKVETFEDIKPVKDSAYRAFHIVMSNLKQKSKTEMNIIKNEFTSESVPKKVFKKRYITGRKHMSAR